MKSSPQVDGVEGEGRDALCSVAVASQLESGGLEGMDLLRNLIFFFVYFYWQGRGKAMENHQLKGKNFQIFEDIMEQKKHCSMDAILQ